jgi:Flp pilus assembly protein TadD
MDARRLSDLINQGLDLHRRGLAAAAAEHYRTAIAGGAGAAAHNLLGLALMEQQQAPAAGREFRRAIALEPSAAEPAGHWGNALQAMGRNRLAAAAYDRAIAIAGDDPLWLRNLGAVLQTLGRPLEAVSLFRRALEKSGEDGEILNGLGSAEMAAGDSAGANRAFRQAAIVSPQLSHARVNLALAALDRDEVMTALAEGARAVALAPRSGDALNALAAATLADGRPARSLRLLRLALANQPSLCEAHYNAGLALMETAELRLAEIQALRALAVKPHYAEAEWNLSLARLLGGDFIGGWRNYEARWRMRRFPTPPRAFPAPPWQGDPLAGRRILLHAEQGLGDTLQFIRYAPMVAAAGGWVILECQEPLKRLLATAPGVRQVYAQGEKLPPFDCHAPLLSLPRLFRTELASVPNAVPYLAARSRAPKSPTQRTIALAWAGSPAHRRDRIRSLPPAIARALALMLLKIPAARTVAFQLGPRRAELADLIEPALGEGTDFEDTAAALRAVDLLIAVDTAIVHLAGALARPAIVLLPYQPDFRWLLGRRDSPWYPTFRLLRQASAEDWTSVLEQIPKEVDALLPPVSHGPNAVLR